jgi:hypothetical protein
VGPATGCDSSTAAAVRCEADAEHITVVRRHLLQVVRVDDVQPQVRSPGVRPWLYVRNYMCPKSCGRMIHAELIYKLLQKVFLLELGGISAGYILKPTHPGPSWQTAQLGVVWHRICVPSFRENCGCIGWERSSY